MINQIYIRGQIKGRERILKEQILLNSRVKPLLLGDRR